MNQMNRGKSSGLIAVVLMAAAVAAAQTGCKKVEQNATGTNLFPAPAPGASAPYYGQRGVDASWPAMPADGQVQKADNLMAKNYEFVFDASGSMMSGECAARGSKWDEAVAAALEFGKSLPADANLGLWVFDASGIRELLPLNPLTPDALGLALRRVQPGGGTPLNSAMQFGYKALQDQAIKQLGNGEYHLVVVTDGQANMGEDPSELVTAIAQRSPVTVHAIGFCIGGDHALNRAGITRYVAANDGTALRKGLADVLAEAPSFDASGFTAQ